MQLTPPNRPSSIGSKLGVAVCLLLTSAPGVARAETPPRWQLDVSGLLYGERQRTTVVEPIGRITRLFANGQRLSATLGIDAITGASPTGGIASTEIQTFTTASGNVQTQEAGSIPTSSFKDIRGSFDLDWTMPVGGWLTTSFGTHVSREKDYQSLGIDGKVSIAFMHKLSTLTLGGGANSDGIFPTGGTRAPLNTPTDIVSQDTNSKHTTTTLVGLSRVLTRRWMVAVDASRTTERGYLTEPYKVLSVVDPSTGEPLSELTESRPGSRDRRDVLFSSVYHFDHDILYASEREYWDDWGIRSHTADLKLRHALRNLAWIEPHVRVYTQNRADFFRYSLVQGEPLPEFASADYRLGTLRTVTLGLTYSFVRRGFPGRWSIRGEYMLQWGNGHPSDAIGRQRSIDLAPPLDIGSVAVGYTLQF